MKKILNLLLGLFIFCSSLSTVFIFDEKIINGFKWQYGTGQLYFSELLLLAFIFLAVFYLLKTRTLTFRKSFFAELLNSDKSRLILSLWLFLGWAGLSILWSPEKSSAYYLWLKLMEGGLLFVILLNLKPNNKIILWPLTLSAGLESIIAIKQFFSQTITANKYLGVAGHWGGNLGDIVIETASERWLRAYGTLAHPNILGGFLVLGIIAGLFLYLQSNKKNRLLLIGLISLISAGLFCSFSRSAWLALVLIFILLIISAGQKYSKNLSELKILKPIFASCLILATLGLIYQPLLQNRADLSNRLEKRSVNERLEQNQQSFAIIKTHPLTGIGLNNYTYYQWQKNPSQPIRDIQPTHNLFGLIASELGLIGLLFFLMLIISVITYDWKRKTTAIHFAPLILILTIACFDHYLLTQFSGLIIFWLSLFLTIKQNDQIDIGPKI